MPTNEAASDHPTTAAPTSATPYVGRFAPSPTGPLHSGSLLCALASYLDAKANNGIWLVRIEDLDPPREQAGADQLILSQLLQHGFQWDHKPVYQSKRLKHYQDALDRLSKRNLTFYCSCSRQELANNGGLYSGACRHRTTPPAATDLAYARRVKCDDANVGFVDLLQGDYSENLCTSCGDFVVLRKDGLAAYQLAVVVDDQAQNISHIVRGSDLLASTPRQIFLQKLLGYQTPNYMHIPVVVDERGIKLSKQSGTAAIEPSSPKRNLLDALKLLGQPSIDQTKKLKCNEILCRAVSQYQRHLIPATLTIRV